MSESTSSQRNRRPRSYGERPSISQDRHYVQVMVYGDCHQQLRELMERHNLSASGAVHHLLRERFSLPPLPPFDQQLIPTDSTHG